MSYRLLPNGAKANLLSPVLSQEWAEAGRSLPWVSNLTHGALFTDNEPPGLFHLDLPIMAESIHAADTAEALMVDLEKDYTQTICWSTDPGEVSDMVEREVAVVSAVRACTDLPIGHWNVYPNSGMSSWDYDKTKSVMYSMKPLWEAIDFYSPAVYFAKPPTPENGEKERWLNHFHWRLKLLREMPWMPDLEIIPVGWWRTKFDWQMMPLEDWVWLLTEVRKECDAIDIWGCDNTNFASKQKGVTSDMEELADEQRPHLQAVHDIFG